MVVQFEQKTQKTFNDLPDEMRQIIFDWLADLRELGNQPAEDEITELEFERRDGFIPHSYNKGGYRLRECADEFFFWSSGHSLPESAQKELDRCTEYSLNCARETFIEHHMEDLSFLGIANDKINYHDLYKEGFGQLAEKLSEYEYENLSGDYSSTEHEIMVMYDGGDAFEITLQHMISDAPYYRSADFCQSWKVRAVTAEQLEKALASITGEVKEVWL